MAIIPSNEQFIGLSSSVNTTERRSALVNAESQAYTMQDIVDTVGSALPPAVNPTDQYVPLNYGGEFADSPIGILAPPGGYFGWAGLRTQVGTTIVPPSGVDQSDIAPYLDYYGLSIQNTPFTGKQTVIGDYNGGTNTVLTIDNSYGPFGRIYATVGGSPALELNTDGAIYTFGEAFVNPPISQVQASGGMAIYGAGGEAIIGCGISSPTNGVFRASGAFGFVTIGTTPSRSIGAFVAGSPAMQIGSALINGTPSNTATPVAWTKVRNESGTIYYSPLYQ
jgi:hypothetical protein